MIFGTSIEQIARDYRAALQSFVSWSAAALHGYRHEDIMQRFTVNCREFELSWWDEGCFILAIKCMPQEKEQKMTYRLDERGTYLPALTVNFSVWELEAMLPSIARLSQGMPLSAAVTLPIWHSLVRDDYAWTVDGMLCWSFADQTDAPGMPRWWQEATIKKNMKFLETAPADVLDKIVACVQGCSYNKEFKNATPRHIIKGLMDGRCDIEALLKERGITPYSYASLLFHT